MDRALVVLGICALVAACALALRMRSRSSPARIDPGSVGLSGDGVAVVGFSSPLCLPCQAWEAALAGGEVSFVKVDVSERPDLARRYRVSATPLILAIRLPDGGVVARYAGQPEPEQVEQLREIAGATPAHA